MMVLGRLHRAGGIFNGDEKIGDTILDAEIVEMVMLEVSDSPVLPNPVNADSHGCTDDVDLVPVRTQKLQGGDYFLVPESGNPEQVTAEEIKVMRARFLLWRDYYYKEACLDRLSEPQKRIASRFIGGMYIPPKQIVDQMYNQS
jgi:hypothetical protein